VFDDVLLGNDDLDDPGSRSAGDGYETASGIGSVEMATDDARGPRAATSCLAGCQVGSGAGASCFVPASAFAYRYLQSAPLPTGAGGVVSSCTNLSPVPVQIDLALIASSGSALGCLEETVQIGQVVTCRFGGGEVHARVCRVGRTDGSALSPRKLACTPSILDASGTATAIVPVDSKLVF